MSDEDTRALERRLAAEGVEPLHDARYRALIARRGTREDFAALRDWLKHKAWGDQWASRSGPTWGDRCRVVAATVAEETRGWPERERRRAFSEAYPFGPKEHFPYKAWRQEVRRALGIKPAKPAWGDPTPSLFA